MWFLRHWRHMIFGRVTPLHDAATQGDVARAKDLLDQGAEVNARDKRGFTPLHLAATADNSDLAELLLRYSADVNIGDRNCWTPLHLCMICSAPRTMRVLLAHGADVDARDEMGNTPLHSCMLFDERTFDLDACPLLVWHKSAANKGDDSTPSIVVALRNQMETISLLLARGADPNAKDLGGDSPLHKVALNYGTISLLTLAASYVETGINSVADDSLKKLVIDMATVVNSIIEELLNRGANVNAKGRDGLTPLEYADFRGHNTVADLLRSHGGTWGASEPRSRITICALAMLYLDRFQGSGLIDKAFGTEELELYLRGKNHDRNNRI